MRRAVYVVLGLSLLTGTAQAAPGWWDNLFGSPGQASVSDAASDANASAPVLNLPTIKAESLPVFSLASDY
ncbi:MAG: hypothetical protein REI12_14655, partial [Pedobacter sp.]|nr:hypothetical protein [Pedobacter sp.]